MHLKISSAMWHAVCPGEISYKLWDWHEPNFRDNNSAYGTLLFFLIFFLFIYFFYFLFLFIYLFFFFFGGGCKNETNSVIPMSWKRAITFKQWCQHKALFWEGGLCSGITHPRSAYGGCKYSTHGDVIKWKHIPLYWPFVCEEYTGPRWIPRTKASDAELWCFLWSAPEKTVE